MNTAQPEKGSTKGSPKGDHPVRSGFAARCPRCGKGKLFDGYLELAKSCNHCGLDNDYVDSADGPAVFVVLFAGFVIVVMAVLVEIYYMPPYWVHAVLWTPLAIFIPLGMLRPLKGALVGVQYKNSAKEARFDKDGFNN